MGATAPYKYMKFTYMGYKIRLSEAKLKANVYAERIPFAEA